ncbi:MAG: hypothetical protein LW630_05480 [Saprospiraceae bacterium]|nr:hypothetical protein [Saprospiraceae bacterium]
MRTFTLFCMILLTSVTFAQPEPVTKTKAPFLWENATVYFLLTDRFVNGDKSNDFVHPVSPAPYRGYMGGDVAGIIRKLEEGYFTQLGIDAIWMTPLVENITAGVDEGTGLSYGFHGYWTKDWTRIDSRIGDEGLVKRMVELAHSQGIRILMDAVVNHTGPVTANDPQWPSDWVRTGPRCTYQSYATTTACTLVENLPDVLTESTAEVMLPQHLVEKWKSEGRYEQEVRELDEFFARTGYPRRPYFYIVKWLTDLIRDYGIDGFRVDTAKHTEEDVWKVLKEESERAFADWKNLYPKKKLDDTPFFMVGEVYNYYIGAGRSFDFGDRKVDYFSHGFDGLINFDFKYDAQKPWKQLFEKYDGILHGALSGKTVLNYLSSHDDGGPYDKERKKAVEAGTRLLLSQGMAQIYYGDESVRSLSVEAQGDAVLRAPMNWEEMDNPLKQEVLNHWRKLGGFRQRHPAVGAGRNFSLSDNVFGRTLNSDLYSDSVVMGVGLSAGAKTIPVGKFFEEGGRVRDSYSGKEGRVVRGVVALDTPHSVVLLERQD